MDKTLFKPLSIEEIDFRVQSINNGGYATILAYKDARVDMNRLDEAFGPLGWKRSHRSIDGNLYCCIEVWSQYRKQWVSKEDVGVESMAEKEKGQASDSFKRAGFNWGIGRDLYDFPVIQVKLLDNEWEKGVNKKPNRQTWNLKLKDWSWKLERSGSAVSFLQAKDARGKVRFSFGQQVQVKHDDAPEPRQVSDRQVAYFHQIVKENDNMEVFRIMSTSDASVAIDLYNSFPAGEKVKGKEIIKIMEKKGREEIEAFAADIMACIDDELDASHFVDQIPKKCVDMVINHLPSEYEMEIRKQITKRAKKEKGPEGPGGSYCGV